MFLFILLLILLKYDYVSLKYGEDGYFSGAGIMWCGVLEMFIEVVFGIMPILLAFAGYVRT